MVGNKNFGERLKSLRVAFGLSLRDLGKKINITAQTLSNYERGLTMPPSPIVIALANELKVKTEYFFRPISVKIKGLDFRKRNNFLVKEQNALMASIKDWLERYKYIETMFPEETKNFLPKIKNVSSFKQIEEAALELRSHWELGMAPIESIASLLEEKNIRVYFIEASDDFDACTFWADDRPCIVARKTLPGDRLRFNLAHELGHLVIKTPEKGDKRTREKPAMSFASTFIVPSEIVKRELGESRKKLSLKELHILKLKYGLSMSAWIYRAKELGIITGSYARSLFIYLRKFGKKEPWANEFPEEAEPIKMKRLVLRAYAESMIS
jgi:Zn-dependent peptidase ImmA (M78 family)/DNA-binding XRE family transcriptional regulator